ncbi:S41 family peptidase [Acaryochloris sp. CCMEE 5410]|uniref:S41 family peptidase n=1 Tax=Acaryochloris sp. CCMEE 5410 TaxID=310037 RepID=UPI000248431C|nr:S41 family peptidase [Acaryochloris sp. CCMEE 5410]KAI9131744.1 S41 family peptidase [Acaryochloris sp. CCMEE 5410]
MKTVIQKLKRHKSYLLSFLITLGMGLVLWLSQGTMSSVSSAQPSLLDAVWSTVNENFYDPKFNSLDWAALKSQYQPQVAKASSRAEKAEVINEMLDQLQTSHTHLFTVDEPAYYQVLGIFYPRIKELRTQLKSTFPEGKVQYEGIGIVTQAIQGKTFIKTIFEGSPAAKAGLKVGDQILNVAGQPFQAIQSFKGKADQPIKVRIQRTADPNDQQTITVTPKRFDCTQMFVEAIANSVQVIETDGQRIGYIHVWSLAGDSHQQELEDEVIYGRLKNADALVLDLRDGWGGDPMTALHLFTSRGPSLTSIRRNGATSTYQGQWNKPVVMLVNEGSRSAKEILAYGFQQYDIGPVVGSSTAGAVVAGRPYLMPDQSLLYVAVSDVYIDKTARLEGVGVTPDVVVPFPIPYAQGQDPQKERAIAMARQAIQ